LGRAAFFSLTKESAMQHSFVLVVLFQLAFMKSWAQLSSVQSYLTDFQVGRLRQGLENDRAALAKLVSQMQGVLTSKQFKDAVHQINSSPQNVLLGETSPLLLVQAANLSIKIKATSFDIARHEFLKELRYEPSDGFEKSRNHQKNGAAKLGNPMGDAALQITSVSDELERDFEKYLNKTSFLLRTKTEWMRIASLRRNKLQNDKFRFLVAFSRLEKYRTLLNTAQSKFEQEKKLSPDMKIEFMLRTAALDAYENVLIDCAVKNLDINTLFGKFTFDSGGNALSCVGFQGLSKQEIFAIEDEIRNRETTFAEGRRGRRSRSRKQNMSFQDTELEELRLRLQDNYQIRKTCTIDNTKSEKDIVFKIDIAYKARAFPVLKVLNRRTRHYLTLFESEFEGSFAEFLKTVDQLEAEAQLRLDLPLYIKHQGLIPKTGIHGRMTEFFEPELSNPTFVNFPLLLIPGKIFVNPEAQHPLHLKPLLFGNIFSQRQVRKRLDVHSKSRRDGC
jgi:hypothetical protein